MRFATLMTTNGQAPFITVYMNLGEARSEQEEHDLSLIIKEVLNQRIEGVKSKISQNASKSPLADRPTSGRLIVTTPWLKRP